jgi:LPPG:FO 2-phospho-L-lactate transferase
MGSVVALAAQFGGAKLADGLYRLRGEHLTVIVNGGDDHDFLGLPMAPDMDTLLYTLSGLANPHAGWEPEGESHACFDMLKRLGGPDRMPLGDKSLALPLLRGEALRDGRRPTEVALEFCRQLGIAARVLPMSDDPVSTQVLTEAGEVRYQEYFEDLGCEPAVRGFFYAGAPDAALSDEVLEALYRLDLEAVVIGPANPYHGIRPILEIPGMRELLRRSGAPVIAVSPIVGGSAHKGSAGKMMTELGHEASARGVAMEYYRLIDGFVVDSEDAALAAGLRASGFEVLATKTFMRSVDDRVGLANEILKMADAIRDKKAGDKQAEQAA